MKFTCGHDGLIPAYMGRGKARQARIDKYFNRVCVYCAVAHAEDFALTLTDTKGQRLADYSTVIAKYRDRVQKLY